MVWALIGEPQSRAVAVGVGTTTTIEVPAALTVITATLAFVGSASTIVT